MKNFLNQDSKSELVRLLVENTPIAYLIMDEDYRIHYVNDYFLKLRKLDMETVLGERCYNLSNGGVPCDQCAVKRAFKTKEKVLLHRKDVLADGTVRYIDDYAIPLPESGTKGRPFVLEMMVDRTAEMKKRVQRDKDYNEIFSILSTLLEVKDEYTATHSTSVRQIAVKLAHQLGMPENEILDISIAASLHDIGKVHIPDSIINKPAPLTEDEFCVIKKHPEESFNMLQGLSSFDNIKNIVRQHHERVDGSGYPDHLNGDEISLGAKIVAVADTYDAITSTRSYREAKSHEYALGEILRVAGSQLDSNVVDAFLDMDFQSDTEKIDETGTTQKAIERFFDPAKNVVSKHKEIGINDVNRVIDEDTLLNALFENTPSGYVLMNPDRNILYANPYFIDYIGFDEGKIIGNICYKAVNPDGKPCETCAIKMAMESGQVECTRQEQKSGEGQKIFDLYGVPMMDADGQATHLVEMIIDRTEEVFLDRRREEDFDKLIKNLTKLLNEQDLVTGEKDISKEVIALRERLNKVMRKELGRLA